MKMIMTLHMTFSTLFMMMKHPLSMGFILLIQTTLSCLINSIYTKSTWFSMILFITFVGGMMIMFIYIASIASNEKFKMSLKMIMLYPVMLIMSFLTTKELNMMMLTEQTLLKNMKLNNKETMSLMKTFNYPIMMMTISMIIYLLITMIITIKITNIKQGPLRTKN